MKRLAVTIERGDAVFGIKRLTILVDAVRFQVRSVLQVLTAFERKITMLSANVKNLVDEVTSMKSVVQSSNAAWSALSDLVADQRKQIGDLQSKLADGSISAEDIQAIDASAKDIHELSTQMQSAVPANTPPEFPVPDAPASDVGTGDASANQPSTSGPTDADADTSK